MSEAIVSFTVRLPKELHHLAGIEASAQSKSLARFIVDSIASQVREATVIYAHNAKDAA